MMDRYFVSKFRRRVKEEHVVMRTNVHMIGNASC